jgi:hypothetical protein
MKITLTTTKHQKNPLRTSKKTKTNIPIDHFSMP